MRYKFSSNNLATRRACAVIVNQERLGVFRRRKKAEGMGMGMDGLLIDQRRYYQLIGYRDNTLLINLMKEGNL